MEIQKSVLRRSTQLSCLNCGYSSEYYGDKWCKNCFTRNKFGSCNNLKELDICEYKKSNIVYIIFWRIFNKTLDVINK